jgi:hypothetical protein
MVMMTSADTVGADGLELPHAASASARAAASRESRIVERESNMG